MLVVVMQNRVLKGLKREPKVLATRSREQIGWVALKLNWRRRRRCRVETPNRVGDVGVKRKTEPRVVVVVVVVVEEVLLLFLLLLPELLFVIVLLMLRHVVVLLLPCCCGVRIWECGFPWWEESELVDGGLGLIDEPIEGLAGPVVAQSVLNVVEFDGGVGGETDTSVPWSLGGANLAVTVLSPSRPYNVTPFHLHYLPTTHSHSLILPPGSRTTPFPPPPSSLSFNYMPRVQYDSVFEMVLKNVVVVVIPLRIQTQTLSSSSSSFSAALGFPLLQQLWSPPPPPL